MRRHVLLIFLLLAALATVGHAAEVIPPRPTAYFFNDYAHVVDDSTAETLERQLTQFERDTSNQIVVAIYPKMQSDSSVEDYTVRVAQNWQVGQKGRNNGAVLFVFVAEHKVYIQVGYGLEGAIPDITAKRIIDDQITPAIYAGNYNAGLTAGVASLIAAAKGEYKGTGTTVHDRAIDHLRGISPFWVIFLVVAFGFILISSFRRHGTTYGARGRSSSMGWQIADGLLNVALNVAFSGGSRSSGGGGGGGSSGGFSSGGGSFGGGGAGGSW